ncbi:MAG: hypothetical protein ACJ735_03525 [Actinomycetes bacterium]
MSLPATSPLRRPASPPTTKRDAARRLHRAEAAYVAQVDAVSRDLFLTVQPVQIALDHLDASRSDYIAAARDAVVNIRTSTAVTRLSARFAKLHPTMTFGAQHTALLKALKDMATELKRLEQGKKSKDAADFLDEPYTGAAFHLSEAEDDWQTQLARLDTATHRAQAPSPGSVGTHRPRATLPASKSSWILGADHACSVAGHAMYKLPKPTGNSSLAAIAKDEDVYATIMSTLGSRLRKLKMPARDRTYLMRTVYRDLHANDVLVQAARETAHAARTSNLSLATDADAKFHLSDKGLSALAHAMTSYGAEHCGWFFSPDAKSTTKNGGSGSITA